MSRNSYHENQTFHDIEIVDDEFTQSRKRRRIKNATFVKNRISDFSFSSKTSQTQRVADKY